MGYRNGAEILPPHLLEEVQKYIEGGLIYVPKRGKKVGWGYLSGSRKYLDKRNHEICSLYYKGISIDDLSSRYHLSEETVRKIIYSIK